MPAAPTRPERDTFGELPVPADALWGAQTQRSLEHFRISRERMPSELVLALVRVKRACARANVALGGLDARKSEAIVLAADEVLAGVHADQFPLSVWQTGSGTQTNMNVNEVLANRASELLGGVRGPTRIVHPNDDVNRSQSSNDVFPTAMHVALAVAHAERVGPACLALREALAAKAQTFADIVKIGRTHLQDAVPITLGQEFSGYVAQLDGARAALDATAPALNALALGGTAVGTGLNAPDGFGARVADLLAQDTALPFVSAANKFEALASHGPIVAYHGALKTLATALHKIANDIRWMASGPRSGLGELRIPENEPGSSIMPGKVNPTQAEALTMACARVLGNDTTIAFCDASGAFELNVYKPAIIDAALQSQRLMADAMDSFRAHCVVGIEPDRARIDALMRRSLMLVTALAPHIGYDRAAQIAKDAHARGVTLEEAAVASGWLTGEQFRAWVRPERMV